jgi:hypothetical protein
MYNILIAFGITMKLVRLIKSCVNETYSRVRVGRYLSDMFAIENGLKQTDALSPFLINLALQCVIRRVQLNQDGLKLIIHISLWFMLVMLIYWEEAYIL